jgi:ELWxxDGT repeat protein
LLFFRANDGANGYELWKSDGTEPGTVLVKDIDPVGSSSPFYLTDVGGKLVFRADDGTNGQELWVTDGSAEGTQLLADVNPGDASSEPSEFTLSGLVSDPLILFSAYDDSIGRELWAVALSDLADCSDGKDNDGDGFCDTATGTCTDGSTPGDPGCTDPTDLLETDLMLPCDDGIDNDGDGRIDFDPETSADPGDETTLPAGEGDPGCGFPTSGTESPECQDGIHNDMDLRIDYDAGLSRNGVADPAGPDPQCIGWPWRSAEQQGSCGLGFELAFLLPLLMWMRRRST